MYHWEASIQFTLTSIGLLSQKLQIIISFGLTEPKKAVKVVHARVGLKRCINLSCFKKSVVSATVDKSEDRTLIWWPPALY